MENQAKTHYRNVFKSDHLGVADLEDMIEKGIPLIFTVTHVTQHLMDSKVKGSGVVVAGRRTSANIAHFKEDIKPLVLNVTNSKILKKFAGGSSWTEDWKSKLIELYIDPSVTMKSERVGGVRIRPTQPQPQKPILTPTHPRWEEAKKAFAEGKDAGVLRVFSISDENLKLIKS